MRYFEINRQKIAPLFLSSAFICFASVTPSLAAEISTKQALEVCRSGSVAEATTKGNSLGWPRAEDDTNWKSSYERYNHVTVDVIGWRDEHTQSALSFWVATGLNPARACSYSLTNKSNLLNDLKIELGSPKSEDHNEVSETAYWNLPQVEIYFTKVGSASGFTLSAKE